MSRSVFTLAALPLILVLATTALPACAASVAESMDDMMLDYAAFNRAKTPAEATKALTKMRADTVAASAAKPARLSNEADNSPKLQAYRAEMNKLIVQIDKTRALAQAGQMEQARSEGKKLMDMRREGHTLFR